MISRCANPDCSSSFDYRSGRFFCFRRPHAPNEPPANAHSVWHFWLCGACSQTHTLDGRSGEVQLSPRLGHSTRVNVSRQIAAA